MKTLSRTSILVALAIMACGCAHIEEQEPLILEQKVFSGVLDESQTKTAYTGEKKVVWLPTDVIRYYSRDDEVAKEAQLASISADSTTASILTETARSDKYIVIVYGGSALSETKASSFKITGAVNPEQDGTFASAHLSVGKTTDMTEETPVRFKNLTSIVKFSIARTDVAYVVFGSADGTDIHGKGSVKVAIDTEGNPSASFGDAGGTSIKVSTSGAGTFYIATLPCTLSKGFTLKCFNAEGKSLGVVTTEKSITLARNDMLNLGTIDSRILPDPDEYYDLSQTETANCYVVSSAGRYQFNATVKGNGSESVGAAAKAKVLWESFGTSTKPEVGSIVKDVVYEGGYIRFNATGVNGNAVVAIADDSDNILWSWHLWACMDFNPATTAQVYANNAGTMMDRDLGALSATPGDQLALGFQYQWGRKDPFPGGTRILPPDSLSHEVAATSVDFPDYVECTSITGTIDYAVANPMTFIKMYGGQSSSYDWIYESTIFEYDSDRWASSKTIYDPCPAGWRVPDGGPTGIWATAGFTSGTFDAVNRGILFAASTPASWYPANGGYTGEGSLDVVGYQGNWWSCTPYYYTSYSLFISQNYIFPATDKNRSMGRAVRCMRTSDAPQVVEVESVELSPSTLTIAAGKTTTLTVNVLPSNATNKTVTWTSSDDAVASVSPTGIVTAVAAGTAEITATSHNGKSASCTVTVGARPYVDGADLSATSTANCYLVTKAGNYKFNASVRGKSSVSLSSIPAKVEVIWESFGTDTAPIAGDVITDVTIDGMYIYFKATGKDGNAVIVGKTSTGLSLWSWHIWVCTGFDPAATAQTYANNAGVMMDRNLGALSATPGDVTSLGLTYQWGRKDPFLSAGSLDSDAVQAASTGSWPNSVESTVSAGTLSNCVIYPMTFITENAYNRDWLYKGSSSDVDNTRWNSNIAQYDPCPEGWTVPNLEIWEKAGFPTNASYDETNKGITVGAEYCGVESWYPFCAWRDNKTGSLSIKGTCGYYSRSVDGIYAKCLSATVGGNRLYINGQSFRARGYSVRCCKEIPVTGIQISQPTLQIGGDVLEGNLTATVLPENAVSKNVTWSSSNPDVVTVNASGKYVAKAAGSAVITVTTEEGGFSASCEVTVTEITTSSLLSRLFKRK